MASVSRTAQFAKVFRVLRKHFKPVTANPDRPVLEHLLLGCCLENAHYEAADEAYAALVETFYDWNEIRVTTISELAEVVAVLPDPRAAANRFKRVLQSLFEETYAFDLEQWRKQNLGPTVKWLKQIDGTTNFTVAYVVQSALGGHAIAIDEGTLGAMAVVDLVTGKDIEAGVVPGLERAIAKSKGVEFGSMLHQLGADFTANPYSPMVREILLEIDPGCKQRLPKRRTGRKSKKGQSVEASQEGAEKPSGTRSEETAARRKNATETPVTETPAKEPGRSKASAGKEKKSSSAEKKPVSTKKTASSRERADVEKRSAHDDPKGRSTSEGLSKRKPR